MTDRERRHLYCTYVAAQSVEGAGNASIAATIVIGNRPVAFGFNQAKTDPMQQRFSNGEQYNFVHAEIHAIKNALKNVRQDKLKNATLYVARSRKDGIAGLAKPCLKCQSAIAHYGIKKVIYTETGTFERKHYENSHYKNI
jgi:tRNA(Arg) A34 adenosine deaminase TadA